MSGKDQRSQETDSKDPSGLAAPWAELKRRKVMRVAITYAVVGWIIMQVGATVIPNLGIPQWVLSGLILLIILGFPIAIVLAWAFELTPDGIKTTKTAEEEGESSSASKPDSLKPIVLAASIPTLLFGALAVFFFIRSSPDPVSLDTGPPVLQVTDLEKSIAVLPLTNMSPDPENAFFADGVHEDILTNLAKIRDLLVIGRTSTLEYRATTKKLQDIGQELGVRYLVEGSVRRAADQVKITVQLIDVQTGGHIWADDYNRSLDDIFAIQAAVAEDIANQLHAVLLPEEIAQIQQLPTKSQAAYDLYVKSRQLYAKEGDLLLVSDEIISLLERAVELDPEFAQALSRLALFFYLDWYWTKNRADSQLLNKADQALAEAKRLAPDSAYVAQAEAFYNLLVLRNTDEANRLLLKALSIDPSFYLCQWNLSTNHRRLGQLVESQFHVEAVLRLDPLHEAYKRRIYEIYRERRLWDEALSEIQKNLDTTPSSDYWKRQLVEIKFLQYGDRQILIEEMSVLPSSQEDQDEVLKLALLSADYAEALKILKGLDSNVSLVFFGGSIPIKYTDQISALIWFARDNLDQCRINAEKSRAYWMGITENALNPGPRQISQLAISHALLGDEAAVEAIIPEIRKLTAEPFSKYHYQAQCEMYIAICYLVLGDHDKALSTLEAACKLEGPISINREMDLWFIFDRLRGNPRFDKLLED